MSSIDDYLSHLQAPVFEQIAPKLRAGRHHVVWKPEQRGQKIGKTPFIARAYLDRGTYYRASSIKPHLWSTFPQAQQAYERGDFAGIGRVLHNDITLVDIDHCIDPHTGAIHPVALEIMATLDTYTERSPGQDGLHIFPAGAIPDTAKNRYSYKGLEIELYSTGRYSTLTGHRIAGTPTDVQERQTNILALIERLERWEAENTLCGCVCGEHLDQAAHNVAQRCPTLPNTDQVPADVTKLAETVVSPNQQPAAAPISERDLPLGDQLVLVKARTARNAAVFTELWEGGDPRQRNDKSKADFDLVLMLLYWTNDNAEQVERLFRASGRYRAEKTDRKANRGGQSYIQHTIENALRKRGKARRAPSRPQACNLSSQTANVPPEQGPEPARRTPARQDRRITHAHPWTRLQETPEQRQEKLQDAARRIVEQVEHHIRGEKTGLFVANVAPGVGKSTSIAPLGLPGVGLNLAWIAERRDMVNQVQALGYYRQIQPCTRHNCQEHHLHNALGERGYNAWSVHKRHKLQCTYAQQFTQDGSAVYQLAHVATRYPTQHDGIIIDELDITKWLPEREITISRLAAAARVYATDSTADLLMRAIAATITDAAQAKRQLHGLEFFNALNKRTGGQLANWIAELAQDGRYTNTHPWYEIEEEDEAAQALEAATLAPVVLPHILVALMNELVKWQRGQAWNSCLRIGPGTHGHALYITECRNFTPSEQGLPARAILDATADAEILSRLFGEQITLEQADIHPPPGTCHLAIRTGKRYGKTSLTAKRKDGSPNRDMARAIAEARYLLRELDPDGSAQAEQNIGIISFKGCVDELGEALGIPEERRLHFWAARGSNALQDCTILLVIGTPCVNPATVARLARALWADDPEPISETTEQDDQGIRQYVDPRMQRLNDYLTRAELTQCAHRSRALRQPRTVITMCLGDIDYLPATETITDLPQLTSDGRERWGVARERERQALDQARHALEEQGKSIHMLTVRELKAAAAVSTDATADYLRQARHVAQYHTQVSQLETLPTTHTHTTCSHTVPDTPSNNTIEHLGTKPTQTAPPVSELPQQQTAEVFTPRRGTLTTPPEYRQACQRCGHVDEWQQDPDTKQWVCSCYWWWYEHPEWRSPIQQGLYLTG